MAQGAQQIEGRRITGEGRPLRSDRDEAQALDAATISPPQPAETMIETIAFEQFDEPELARASLADHVAVWACVTLAMGWIAALIAGVAMVRPPRAPALIEIAELVALASGPLALIGIVYLLSRRSGRREQQRFAHTAEAMRGEAERLERTLAILTRHVGANRTEIEALAEALATLGRGALTDLERVGASIRTESEALAINSAMLGQAAVSARGDMARLMDDLPRAEAQASATAALIRSAGDGAGAQSAMLGAALGQLAEQSRAAERLAAHAGDRLAQQVAAIDQASAAADRTIEQTHSAMSNTIDEALTGASRAIDETRKAMRAQAEAMLAMVDQGRAALDGAGSHAAQAMSDRLDQIGGRLDRFATRLADQDAATRTIVERLDAALATIETRLAAIGEDGTARTADLAEAIVALSGHVDSIGTRIAASEAATTGLIGRAETLRASIDASQETIDQVMPLAIERARADLRTVAEAIAMLTPAADRLAAAAAETRRTLGDGEGLIVRQERAVAAFAEAARGRFADLGSEAAALDRLIRDAEAQARGLAEGASAHLIDALLRVREAANQAAERAREALGRVIPDSAAALAAAGGDALDKALGDTVATHLATIGAAAESAVGAAHKATERLMRQMLTITETTAQVEARIDDAKDSIARQEDEGFGRRVSLLIESLNSTAIDVTKILSNEVTDGAWAAYLRGDRGVFTRRAVRLIDSGEAREIARHYDAEPEFREQVNRYIHDFEAMLRRVLASRDGGPLGVTMLSSDMGKLYVALAQAIERLRG